ncbi:MAG TPA: hypothetical protein VL442_08555 [Mucilaginibacter sp.]|jgi:hypothetical protein|nr:hypothetical protein [Mucilaginibacter sp.]
MEPSIKNENATSAGSDQQDLFTKAQVQSLSDHMFNLLQVSENGAIRKMNSSNPSDPTKNDTRRAYFSKAKLDAFFDANPGSDGLYIYFGAYNSAILPSGKKNFENKLTAMMVTAKGTALNLTDTTSAAGTAMALGPQKTCPPDICP